MSLEDCAISVIEKVIMLKKVKLVLPIICINMILPTVDVLTDVILIVKLGLIGAYGCYNQNSDYDPWGDNSCPGNGSPEYCQCYNETAEVYCRKASMNEEMNSTGVCQHQYHPQFASYLLVPFLLNYIVCFVSWTRYSENKSKTFIFPILNIYPQFGK